MYADVTKGGPMAQSTIERQLIEALESRASDHGVDIVDVEEDTTHKELWRLFDMDYTGDADALPQDTSLRRAYVKRLKENKPLGLALGVWLYKVSE